MTPALSVKAQKEKKVQTEEVLQLVSFNIGQEEFGLDIQRIQESIEWWTLRVYRIRRSL